MCSIVGPKHGVNPAIPVCFYCTKESNESILSRVWDKTPCEQCQLYMKQGVILIQIRDRKSGQTPYRMGGWVVVKDEDIKRIVPNIELVDDLLQKRVAFIDDKVWQRMGLDQVKPTEGGEK